MSKHCSSTGADDAPDSVIIGAGHNGAGAANVLVDAGWPVAVHEATAQAGGSGRLAQVTAPGFRADLFSAFYPLSGASQRSARLPRGVGIDVVSRPSGALARIPRIDARRHRGKTPIGLRLLSMDEQLGTGFRPKDQAARAPRGRNRAPLETTRTDC